MKAFLLGTYHLIIWEEAWLIFTQRNVIENLVGSYVRHIRQTFYA